MMRYTDKANFYFLPSPPPPTPDGRDTVLQKRLAWAFFVVVVVVVVNPRVLSVDFGLFFVS